MFEMSAIGVVHSCFSEKFGIPRQPGLAPAARAKIIIQPPFDQEQAFAGLAEVSHIWLQFVFHKNREQPWRPRVRPPRLGGNRSVGVFASRSPFRPNALGLSVVRLLGMQREQGSLCLHIAGHDLLDQTPVIDIKPYVPYVDHVADAHNSWAQQAPPLLPVKFARQAESTCRELSLRHGFDWRQLVLEVLQQDPRPAYHQAQPERIYGCKLYQHDVRWTVESCADGVAVHVIELIPVAAQ